MNSSIVLPVFESIAKTNTTQTFSTWRSHPSPFESIAKTNTTQTYNYEWPNWSVFESIAKTNTTQTLEISPK